MTRAINIDEVLKIIDAYDDIAYDIETVTSITDGIHAKIEAIQSADFVSVVQCKYCKHAPYRKDIKGKTYIKIPEYKDGIPDYTCPYICDDHYYTRVPNDNSFCDKGERKDIK